MSCHSNNTRFLNGVFPIWPLRTDVGSDEIPSNAQQRSVSLRRMEETFCCQGETVNSTPLPTSGGKESSSRTEHR